MSNKRGSTSWRKTEPREIQVPAPRHTLQAAALRVNQIQSAWFGGSQAGSLCLCGLVIPLLFNCSFLISFSFGGA